MKNICSLLFIDTHCHLDASEFTGAQNTLVQEALSAGVSTIVVPAVTATNFAAVKNLCQLYDNCAPAYGIHPMYTNNAQPADLDLVRAYLMQENTVAVGEIGLDFFVDNFDQKNQEYYFIEQLLLAREFELPVLLHVRKAQDTILKHLRQHKVCGGIAHAFNGSAQQAAEFIKLGFKLGFGGAMTYPRATKIRELAATLPLESIVLETDAPDIPPAFLQRGLANRPSNLPLIAQTLADLRGLSLDEIARVTTENARSALPKLTQFIPILILK